MARKPPPLTDQQVKDAADRAEGIKPKRGRPSTYQKEYAKQAEKLCKLGATDTEMAGFFEISPRTFYQWKHDYPEFAEAMKAGKEIADERVVRSLYQRAVGYTIETEKVFQFQGEVVRAATKEQITPDTTAMIFWLKNRRPEEWRDRQELTGKNGGPVQIVIAGSDKGLL